LRKNKREEKKLTQRSDQPGVQGADFDEIGCGIGQSRKALRMAGTFQAQLVAFYETP
jgi:hypothetical protein